MPVEPLRLSIIGSTGIKQSLLNTLLKSDSLTIFAAIGSRAINIALFANELSAAKPPHFAFDDLVAAPAQLS